MNAPLDLPLTARGPQQSWVPTAFASVLGVAASLVMLLVVRRLAGSLTTPLGLAGLLATAVLLAAAAAGMRLAWRRLLDRDARRSLRWLDFLVRWFPAVCLAAAIAAIWIPGTSRWGMLALFAIVYLEEAWSCRGKRWHGATLETPGQPDEVVAPQESSMTPSAELDVPPALAGEIQQQFVRSRTAEGAETIAGRIRVPLEARQRTAFAHLAFCPPLEQAPELQFRQLAGPAARIKLGQSLPYGARLELKLASPPEERVDVLVEFEARAE